MKIQFKISRTQLMVWLAFLESRWIEPSNTDGPYSRLVYHALSDLLHKLKIQAVVASPNYRFSISSVSGLAFMVFCEYAKNYLMDPSDEAIINGIIGTIDKKTK